MSVPPSTIEPAHHPRVVVVYGDSITEGLDLPLTERHHLWVRTVETRSGGRLRLINEGKGGRPTDSQPEFEAALARNPRADVLVLALGGNDARDITDACVPKALANLRTLITRGRQAYGPDLRILLVAPTNIRKDSLGPTRPIANERDAKLRELGAAYVGLAAELGCACVSLYGVVPPETLTVDGVHPLSLIHI